MRDLWWKKCAEVEKDDIFKKLDEIHVDIGNKMSEMIDLVKNVQNEKDLLLKTNPQKAEYEALENLMGNIYPKRAGFKINSDQIHLKYLDKNGKSVKIEQDINIEIIEDNIDEIWFEGIRTNPNNIKSRIEDINVTMDDNLTFYISSDQFDEDWIGQMGCPWQIEIRSNSGFSVGESYHLTFEFVAIETFIELINSLQIRIDQPTTCLSITLDVHPNLSIFKAYPPKTYFPKEKVEYFGNHPEINEKRIIWETKKPHIWGIYEFNWIAQGK
jgi:hypothetical protein